MKHLLNKDELQTLSKLKGKRLDFVAGNYLTTGMNSDVVYVGAENLTISIAGDSYEQDFGGFDEEFSFFRVKEIRDLSIDVEANSIRFRDLHKGEEIRDISISRLEAIHRVDSENTISVMTDRAIILHLSGGTLAIARRSLHLDMIEMSFSDEVNQPLIRELSSHYKDEDHGTYQCFEEILTLQKAFSEAAASEI